MITRIINSVNPCQKHLTLYQKQYVSIAVNYGNQINFMNHTYTPLNIFCNTIDTEKNNLKTNVKKVTKLQNSSKTTFLQLFPSLFLKINTLNG